MKLNYLLVVLNNSSVPFCYYNARTDNNNTDDSISLYDLKKTIVFALKNNLKINFLFPRTPLDQNYINLIEEIEHIKIIPFSLHKEYLNSILVIESDSIPNPSELKGLKEGNFILRLRKEELASLALITNKLIPACSRLNLVLLDIEKYRSEDYIEYQNQLKKISDKLLKSTNAIFELNFLTDRIALTQMNNCNAGLSHLTVAPNGKLYICPAFYHKNREENLGEIRNDIQIANQKLLELKNAPICKICDAYQCKRCVFLNRETTRDVNIPSAQQCILSHKERESSRVFLNSLVKKDPENKRFNVIPELDYEDPFEIVKDNPQKFSEVSFKKQ